MECKGHNLQAPTGARSEVQAGFFGNITSLQYTNNDKFLHVKANRIMLYLLRKCI